jgi:hypothetical protein
MKPKNFPARKLLRQQEAGPDTNLPRGERKKSDKSQSINMNALESARNIRTKKRRTAKA